MPKNIDNQTLIGSHLHEWTIPEYEQHNRGILWYVLTISVGIIFVLYGLFSDNFIFSLIIILAAIIVFLQSHQDPLQVSFKITELGLVVGNRFYDYSELDDFYIIYNPPEVKTLFFSTKSIARPTIRIPLLDQNPLQVRESLQNFLDEDLEKEEEPKSDLLARRWKIH